MAAGTQRLDRFIAQTLRVGRSQTRLLLAQKRLWIDDEPATSCDQLIDYFSHIRFDQKILQARTAHYLMLNKPKGYVSATKDDRHPTVMDLIQETYKDPLHIVGRLDFNSTGLMLLTNDSRWSEKLMQPAYKVAKHYHVQVSHSISNAMIKGFAEGIYFSFEELMTAPATLNRLDDYHAEVILTEGKYHQVKRMFGHFQNQVLALHRTQIGALQLDPLLMPGQFRNLQTKEVESVFNHSQHQLNAQYPL